MPLARETRSWCFLSSLFSPSKKCGLFTMSTWSLPSAVSKFANIEPHSLAWSLASATKFKSANHLASRPTNQPTTKHHHLLCKLDKLNAELPRILYIVLHTVPSSMSCTFSVPSPSRNNVSPKLRKGSWLTMVKLSDFVSKILAHLIGGYKKG